MKINYITKEQINREIFDICILLTISASFFMCYLFRYFITKIKHWDAIILSIGFMSFMFAVVLAYMKFMDD